MYRFFFLTRFKQEHDATFGNWRCICFLLDWNERLVLVTHGGFFPKSEFVVDYSEFNWVINNSSVIRLLKYPNRDNPIIEIIRLCLLLVITNYFEQNTMFNGLMMISCLPYSDVWCWLNRNARDLMQWRRCVLGYGSGDYGSHHCSIARTYPSDPRISNGERKRSTRRAAVEPPPPCHRTVSESVSAPL